MTRKLFECEVTFTYYAYAEDVIDAESFADDAARDVSISYCVSTKEIKTRPRCLADDWTEDSLVYHSDGEEITLKDVLNVLPK